MSIRTKLLLSYIAMILIPVVLLGVSAAVSSAYFLRGYETGQQPDNTSRSHGRFAGPPIARFGQWFGERDELVAGLTMIAKYDSPKLADADFLLEINKQLSRYDAGIVITSGGEIAYASTDIAAEAQTIVRGRDRGYSADTVFFTDAAGSDGAMYVVLNNRRAYDFFGKFIPTVLLTLLGALIVTNGTLTYLVSRSIIRPLDKLKTVADHIREGNLDEPVGLARRDEIGKLGLSFEEMRVRLKASIETQLRLEDNRKELLANISHDLKTPIAAIRGCVDCLRDGVADTAEKRTKYVGMIDRKAADIDRLVEELSLYSTLDMKRLPLHRETIDLNRYLELTVEELRLDPRFAGVGIAYRYTPPPDQTGPGPRIRGDGRQLHRAIMNILDNSLKYMDGDERNIVIELLAGGRGGGERRASIRLTDSGPGIPPDKLPYVFERFYRADSARSADTGGSGLGLAIVKQIAELHGGTATAESAPGSGLTIVLELPADEPTERGGQTDETHTDHRG